MLKVAGLELPLGLGCAWAQERGGLQLGLELGSGLQLGRYLNSTLV